MHTVELTGDELRIVLSALHAYLDDFGHEEADVLREAKAVLAKLTAETGDAGGGLSVERLAGLLREAEQAHGAYERELGRRDEDWPAWYASYVLDRLAGD